MDDECELMILEMRINAALYLLGQENLESARRNRLIEFLERVANGEEFILLETEHKSGNYNERDFDEEDS